MTDVFYYVCFFLGVLFTLLNIAYTVGLHTAVQMFRENFFKELPYIIPCALAVIFAFISEKKKAVAFVSAAVIAVTSLTAAVNIGNMSAFAFDATPSVFDTGAEYSIVWATSDDSVGYVEYSYKGVDYKVYDEKDGRIVSNTGIHSVSVPYEALRNNTYSISAQRVKSNVAYTPRLGKTIAFSALFKGTFDDEINITAITDNHNCRLSYFDKTADEKTDALFIMGDFADMVSDEKTIVSNLLYPAATISKGETPVIFVKGNHDDRGEASTELNNILGMDSFYYQTYLGDYRLTILDSGECNTDDFVEYGGLANFESYREKELEWMNGIVKEKGKYDIVLCHDPVFSFTESVAEEYNEKLGPIGTDLCVSGHLHQCKYYENGYETTKYPTVICGGITDDIFKNNLAYTTIVLKGDTADITGKTVKGEEVYKDSAALTKS